MIGRANFMRSLRLGIVSAVVLMTVGCGNGVDSNRTREAYQEIKGQAKTAFSKRKNAESKAAPDPNRTIAATLAKIPDVPLLFTMRESTGAFSVSSVYAQNAETVTWVNASRDTFSLKQGHLIATRGLGNDLMSVEDGGAARIIAARRTGRVQKTYRFLNGLDQTARFTTQCQIETGERQQVQSGEILSQTTIMRESCSSGDYKFTNVYWVDDTGRSVQSLQWAGHANGNIVFRRIR